MSLWKSIKQYFRKRKLQREISKRPRVASRPVHFTQARSIGILFDASQLDQRQAVVSYAEGLRTTGRQVKLLGYFDSKQEQADFTFPFISRKQINWYGCPVGDEVDDFLDQAYEFFFFLHPVQKSYANYLAQILRAPFKVGPPEQDAHCYDLMVEIRDKQDVKKFISEIEAVLQKTNAQHEPAKI